MTHDEFNEACLRIGFEITYHEDGYDEFVKAGLPSKDTSVLWAPKAIAALVKKHLKVEDIPAKKISPKPEKFLKLTPRQKDVFQLIIRGYTGKEIAKLLFVSPKTLETHRSQLADRGQFKGVADMCCYAAQHGLYDMPLREEIQKRLEEQEAA